MKTISTTNTFELFFFSQAILHRQFVLFSLFVKKSLRPKLLSESVEKKHRIQFTKDFSYHLLSRLFGFVFMKFFAELLDFKISGMNVKSMALRAVCNRYFLFWKCMQICSFDCNSICGDNCELLLNWLLSINFLSVELQTWKYKQQCSIVCALCTTKSLRAKCCDIGQSSDSSSWKSEF